MASEKKIAVVGATGRLGHHAVEILRERGHEVVPISRSEGVDVISGEGLGAALEGVDLIVDAASSPTPEGAAEFFTSQSLFNLCAIFPSAFRCSLLSSSLPVLHRSRRPRGKNFAA